MRDLITSVVLLRASIAREAECDPPLDPSASMRYIAIVLLDQVFLRWWFWITMPLFAIAVGYATGR